MTFLKRPLTEITLPSCAFRSKTGLGRGNITNKRVNLDIRRILMKHIVRTRVHARPSSQDLMTVDPCILIIQ